MFLFFFPFQIVYSPTALITRLPEIYPINLLHRTNLNTMGPKRQQGGNNGNSNANANANPNPSNNKSRQRGKGGGGGGKGKGGTNGKSGS